MCVSSSSSLAADSSSAMDKRLLEANLILFVVAIRRSLRLLVGHVVVRHDVLRDEGRLDSIPILLSPNAGMSDGYIEGYVKDG